MSKKRTGPGTLDVLMIILFLGVIPTLHYYRWPIIAGVSLVAIVGFSL
jgi:hypothetical protein